MDPITQLEDSLDTLLKVMASAIAYLSRKAGHKQVNARVPLTVLGTTEALPDDVLKANRDELVHDLVSQAKEVEQHIRALPSLDTDEEARTARLEALQTRLHTANDAYRAAVQEAHTLLGQLDTLLERLCAERQAARDVLDPPPAASRGESGGGVARTT
ncbi:hypothetical protein GLX27_002290 [Malassezia furfur]|uniref:Mediator of RNA polymerase II transcription subunit 21 n=1 Tax=Malassezia furfur TaxID=55194 RepID=A0ABY8EQ75_MALFU|nr:hypothetical protein GLX27_002290 [Malassezia furfur]